MEGIGERIVPVSGSTDGTVLLLLRAVGLIPFHNPEKIEHRIHTQVKACSTEFNLSF